MIRSYSYLKARRRVVIAGLAVAWMAAAPRAARGQSSWPSYPNNSAITVTSNGSVGIGTTSPSSLLTIVGNPTTLSPQLRLAPAGIANSATSVPSYLDFYSSFDDYPTDQAPRRTATIKAHFSGGPWTNEVLAFEVGTGTSNDAGNEPIERMRITGTGNVGIGTTNPQYLLSVNGQIGAKDVIVTNSGWSDYVFQAGYRLRPLSEVNAYIQANHHLPDIPSEAEVNEKGVSVNEMQKKLLAKVEELTLHMIRQEKDNHDLRDQNRELQDRIARLEARTSVTSAPAVR